MKENRTKGRKNKETEESFIIKSNFGFIPESVRKSEFRYTLLHLPDFNVW